MPKNHKGSADLWATAASADLFHLSLVARRSVDVARRSSSLVAHILEFLDGRRTATAEGRPAGGEHRSSLLALNLHYAYLLTLLTLLTLPYLPYLLYWWLFTLFIRSRSPKD